MVEAALAWQAERMQHEYATTDPDELRQRRMLVWLADQTDGFYSFEDLYADDSQSYLARRDVDSLEQQGFVLSAMGGGPSLDAVHASISSAGRRYATELQSELRDQPRRNWACRERLLKWLYQVDATQDMSRARAINDFVSDDFAIYVIDRFNVAEADRASSWLRRAGLIDGLVIDEAEGPVKAYLVDSGVRCVEDLDGNIRRYQGVMNSRATVSTAPVLNVNATNVQVATGYGSQQTMNMTQLPEQLTNIIEGIAQIIAALGLDVGQEADLSRVRSAAIAEVTSVAPTTGAVRRFHEWVIERVRQGGTAALAAAVTAASNGLLHDTEAFVHAMSS